MRPYDRDYYVSTLSVLSNNVRSIMSLCDDLMLRLEELEETLIITAEQEEDKQIEHIFNQGVEYAEWENDTIVYDSLRGKLCTCDECWGVESDNYEHRMD